MAPVRSAPGQVVPGGREALAHERTTAEHANKPGQGRHRAHHAELPAHGRRPHRAAPEHRHDHRRQQREQCRRGVDQRRAAAPMLGHQTDAGKHDEQARRRHAAERADAGAGPSGQDQHRSSEHPRRCIQHIGALGQPARRKHHSGAACGAGGERPPCIGPCEPGQVLAHRQQQHHRAEHGQQTPVTAAREDSERSRRKRGAHDQRSPPAAGRRTRAAGAVLVFTRVLTLALSLAPQQPEHGGHADRQHQVHAAREGGQAGIARCHQQRALRERSQRRSRMGVAVQRKGQRQRKVRIECCATDMHLPEQGGRAVVGREVEQAREGDALPRHGEHHPRKAKRHAQRQALRRALRVAPLGGTPQRQQQQGKEPGLAGAHAVQRFVVALEPTERRPACVQDTAPDRNDRCHREAPDHEGRQRRWPRRQRRGWVTADCRARLASGREREHEQVKFLDREPAAPWCKADHRQQRRNDDEPGRRPHEAEPGHRDEQRDRKRRPERVMPGQRHARQAAGGGEQCAHAAGRPGRHAQLRVWLRDHRAF